MTLLEDVNDASALRDSCDAEAVDDAALLNVDDTVNVTASTVRDAEKLDDRVPIDEKVADSHTLMVPPG